MKIKNPKRFFPLAVILMLLATSAGTSLANELVIQATGGLTVPTGAVGDTLVGGGVVFGGQIQVSLTDQFYLAGGTHISIFGGAPDEGPEFTDGGFGFTFEGGGVFYLLGTESQVRPYVAGFLGWGFIDWNYPTTVANALGVDSDSNAFIYFAPEAGLRIGLSGDVGLVGGARYVVAGYGDETRENFQWDIDGGNFVQVFGGLAFSL